MTCGTGFRQRTVECSRTDVTCDPRKKPTTTARCDLSECPKWQTGQWSRVSFLFNTIQVFICLLITKRRYNSRHFVLQCSVTCGDGTKRRSVLCSGGKNKCDSKTKPEPVSKCNLGVCPQWEAGEWSQVDKKYFCPLSSHPNVIASLL